ncbi:putative membrane protein [Rhizomicrobium palustre]|uniref:Putative membrane protein n=1 Tax=Rhizomicrobium palustre TaxID=189966 RepID=A0A846MVK0_9PROT|nr:DUF4199 domain-containing protein [Rhizomicrobium palustre]NIK87090.1 putative membrane protein [Rhizomicrobium palustre]
MIRIILVFGALSGLVLIASLGLTMFLHDHAVKFPEWMGYVIMLAALSLIFVGVKRYRDQVKGGVMRFVDGAKVGLGIAAIASITYVLAWEVYLWLTDYRFFPNYMQSVIAAKKAAGISAADLAKLTASLQAMAESYTHPLSRMAITLTEIAPLALIVALISAAVLRFHRILPARG